MWMSINVSKNYWLKLERRHEPMKACERALKVSSVVIPLATVVGLHFVVTMMIHTPMAWMAVLEAVSYSSKTCCSISRDTA